MPHGLLDGPWTDTVFHAVRGITVAEFVRQHRDTKFASGVPDRALEIGLMHPVSHFQVCTWMEASGS